MVTSVPKLRKMEANSTPTAPAPMTMRDFGTWGMERISMLVRMRSSGCEAEDCFGVGAGGEDDVFRFDLAGFAVCAAVRSTVWTPSLAGPVSRAVAGDDGDLVLLHQELKALGVLVDDGGLALEHAVPIELRSADAVDAEFGRVLEVVPDFGVEEQRLGGDAADVEAGAAEDVCGIR